MLSNVTHMLERSKSVIVFAISMGSQKDIMFKMPKERLRMCTNIYFFILEF